MQSLGDSRMRDKRLKWALRLVLAWIILAAIGPCTVTHRFGPYYGKVVDRDTAEPIAGAVVLVEFRTLLYTLAGFTSHFVDALETVTDQNGTFHIAAHRSWVFRFPHKWEKNCDVVIFQRGYGGFPFYPGVRDRYEPGFSIPSDQNITVRLPKLKTREERQNNMSLMPIYGVPEEKRRNLTRLIEAEMDELGYLKYKNPRRTLQ